MDSGSIFSTSRKFTFSLAFNLIDYLHMAMQVKKTKVLQTLQSLFNTIFLLMCALYEVAAAARIFVHALVV